MLKDMGGLMGYIDMHCDTLMVYASEIKEDLYENSLSVDIRRLRKAGAAAQFFAIWMPDRDTIDKRLAKGRLYSIEAAGLDSLPEGEYEKPEYSDERYFKSLYDGFKECMQAHRSEVSHVGCYEEYIKNRSSGKLSAFLTLEDGRLADGSIERLMQLKKAGVSLITLTWNFKNCFGSPNSFNKDEMTEGLTEFGREAVEYMQNAGIIVDVSHLSDGGFMDIADICRKPFVASHSNARALSPHPRNLTDEMIKIIGEKGGIAGLNFCPYFLNQDITDKNSTVEALCRHAGYLADKGGIECVALGSDLDGIEGNIEIDSADKMEYLFEGLKKAGFKESELDKIRWQNAERVIKDTLY